MRSGRFLLPAVALLVAGLFAAGCGLVKQFPKRFR
jgi:hypothetical protein